ncbi:MAG: putative toxin-antitoxin system toxin component, PIN family [bacterium]
MRIVIDTNVLISAAICDRVPELILRWIGAHVDFEWIVSASLLAEYREVLQRPRLGVPVDVQHAWESILGRLPLVEVPSVLEVLIRDPKDRLVLACAIGGRADIIVTGDRDFENLEGLSGVEIFTVSQFYQRYVAVRGV